MEPIGLFNPGFVNLGLVNQERGFPMNQKCPWCRLQFVASVLLIAVIVIIGFFILDGMAKMTKEVQGFNSEVSKIRSSLDAMKRSLPGIPGE